MARFGIELEVISKKTSEDIATILRDNGIECYSEGYNHQNRRHWKIVPDTSIRTSRQKPNGFEVVSPILEGDDGFLEAEKVANVLNGKRMRREFYLRVPCSRGCQRPYEKGTR